ncbi:shikimate kinase [Oleiagrimonas sp. C23AA]|uniref:shikimate kinase n=1 Tax=Oleiagrimonas sp. C23AA TaxID=2719047 RepID=UPI00141ED10F|nr:shikimate kinase [Oleiagrimonas sp. C23AA]NII12007.1 shikimate kinase [Oleiagrimonas sp. C23AA]
MNPSPNLFVIGPTGAGKTSIGRRLAAHYGLPFLDLDHEIEARTGVDIPTIFDIEGEAGFRHRESETLAACAHAQGVVLATGAGAVLADANRTILRAHGYVVWLQASIAQQVERLQHDASRPLLAGDDRHTRFETMAREREPLYQSLADLAVPGRHEPVAAASRRAISLIDTHWQRQDSRQSA